MKIQPNLSINMLKSCALLFRYFCGGIILWLCLSGNINAQEILSQERLNEGAANKQTVKIEITSHLGDQQVFVENDLISFFISLDHSAYIYAFYQDAKKNIFQILPSKAQPSHFFNAGYYMPFPAEDSVFKFQVQAPFGRENLFIFASDQHQIKFSEKVAANELMRLSINRSEIEQHIKSVSNGLYGYAQIIIQTQMKSSRKK